MTSEFVPDQETLEQIRGLIEELFTLAPGIMGIDETISGCQVLNMDPYGTGVYPRYIRVSLRGQYYVDAYYYGNPALVVGDFCSVLHLREGDRYEVIGGGAGFILPWLAIWQFDVSTGMIIPHPTIVAAIAACPAASGDYVLIPPGTYNEAITLKDGVYVTEQIPGTVILNYTGGTTCVTTAINSYLQVKEIRVTRNVNETSMAIDHSVAGDCTIIAEIIHANNANAAVGTDARSINFNSNHNLYVTCERLDATSGRTAHAVFGGGGTGTCHVHAKFSTITAGTWAYCVENWGGNDVNIYGPDVTCTGVNLSQVIRCTSGTVNAHDVKATSNQPAIVMGDGAGIINIYDSVFLPSVGGLASGIWVGGGTTSLYHCQVTGYTNDLDHNGGTLNVHRVRYDTTNGTISYLSGDRRVQDLDDDTSISALAVDDQIDVEIAGGLDFQWVIDTFRVLGGSRVEMADDTWVGLGAAAGRIVWDSTPVPDEVNFPACESHWDSYQDIYPDDAGRGLWVRGVNRSGMLVYDWHFRAGDPAPPTGYAWQGAPFVAPGAVLYAHTNDYLAALSTGGNRSFMSTPVANNAAAWQNKEVRARFRTGITTQIGVRFDDGTDNNYAEIRMSGAAADATQRLTFVWRQGGGVTTVLSNLIIPADTFVCIRLSMYSGGGSYHAYGYIIGEDGSGVNIAGFNHDFGAIGPFPAAGRVGVIVENTGNYGLADWLYETFG